MSVESWVSFFQELSSLLETSERRFGIANSVLADHLIERLELAVQSCTTIVASLDNPSSSLNYTEEAIITGYKTEIEELIGHLRSLLDRWKEYRTLLDSTSFGGFSYQAPVAHTGRRGRPRFDIDKEQIEYLLTLSFTWSEISALLGISRMTLYRRRMEFGLVDYPNSDLSDEDLSEMIREFRQDNPDVGASMVAGLLRARGYRVVRARIRDALRNSDPLSAALRWPGGITRRRVYSVAGPNSLWHIDSHHKLIRWRLATHGGIDGYSRLIVYLKCTSNIRSTTIYDSFLGAVREHHLPSRVRSDQGGENVLVAQHMIEHRGSDRGSMIVGSSVHNQRIERLWKDMHKCVTSLYYKLFYFMEQCDLLDQLNEKHIYALHFIFIPRINKALTHFMHGWNHHPIRTASNKSPHQLFTAGMLILRHSQLVALDFFDHVDSTYYGIDEDGPVPTEDDNSVVQIPECSYVLSDADFTLLRQTIDPLSPSEEYGIDLYEQTLQLLDHL